MGTLERKWMTAAEPCLLTRADTGAPETLMEDGDFKISCAVGPVTTIDPENCYPRLDCTPRLFMDATATVEPLATNKPVTSFKFIFDLDIIPQSLYLYINIVCQSKPRRSSSTTNLGVILTYIYYWYVSLTLTVRETGNP